MAIDTENKRKAAIAAGRAWRLLPVPDGSISALDRRHMAGFYRLVTGVGGPYDVAAGQVYAAGVATREIYVPGVAKQQLYTPGVRTGEVNS